MISFCEDFSVKGYDGHHSLKLMKLRECLSGAMTHLKPWLSPHHLQIPSSFRPISPLTVAVVELSDFAAKYYRMSLDQQLPNSCSCHGRFVSFSLNDDVP